jgi:sugar phosphate isomerase/epimerase
MVKIVVPTRACKRDDVETMLRVLERTVKGSGHEFGLEIVGRAGDFQSEEGREATKKNIRELASGAYLVVHGFSGLAVYEEGSADMRTETGKQLLDTYVKLGADIGASYVHVHSGAGYRGVDLKPEVKKAELLKVRRTLESAGYNPRYKGLIGIENLPNPSMGDVDTYPCTVWRDCVDSLEDCLTIVKGTMMMVTFDTCHYACDREGENIDLIESFKLLGAHAHHLHISDVTGRWIPYQSVWTEGVIPGEGRIGEEQFKRFFSYIRDNNPSIGLCVEVANKDFTKPVETEVAVRKVLDWLR